MKTLECERAKPSDDLLRPETAPGGARVSHLYLVTPHDVASLKQEFSKPNVPPDFEAKLVRLAKGTLSERFIEQNCRCLIALFEAAGEGGFRAATPAECERILLALAYVRKEEDAIPDYRTDGFSDDQQELRALLTELGPLLREFKEWRLRHQVPGFWLAGSAAGGNDRPRATHHLSASR